MLKNIFDIIYLEIIKLQNKEYPAAFIVDDFKVFYPFSLFFVVRGILTHSNSIPLGLGEIGIEILYLIK